MAAVIPVDDPADDRLEDFVGLRHRETPGDLLIAEGTLVIRHLLQSPYPLRSILLTPRGLRSLEPDLETVAAPVYLAPQSLVEAVCGFRFHRGALASADRGLPLDARAVTAGADLLLVVEGVNDNENLGGLFRNAAAFGVDGVLLDPTCADPLYRRSIRVSMGHALRLPFARLPDWPGSLASLGDDGLEVIALTPAGEAEDLRSLKPGGRRAVLVGSEGTGLSPAALSAAARRVRIAVAPGVDSLNVATAAAVALHHLAELPE